MSAGEWALAVIAVFGVSVAILVGMCLRAPDEKDIYGDEDPDR